MKGICANIVRFSFYEPYLEIFLWGVAFIMSPKADGAGIHPSFLYISLPEVPPARVAETKTSTLFFDNLLLVAGQTTVSCRGIAAIGIAGQTRGVFCPSQYFCSFS